MRTKGQVEIFIDPKELRKFKRDYQYSVTYPKQWSKPGKRMKAANVEKIVYIKDVLDDKYLVFYLSTPV